MPVLADGTIDPIAADTWWAERVLKTGARHAEAARKNLASRTPEYRSALARKGHSKRSRAARSASARRGAATLAARKLFDANSRISPCLT